MVVTHFSTSYTLPCFWFWLSLEYYAGRKIAGHFTCHSDLYHFMPDISSKSWFFFPRHLRLVVFLTLHFHSIQYLQDVVDAFKQSLVLLKQLYLLLRAVNRKVGSDFSPVWGSHLSSARSQFGEPVRPLMLLYVLNSLVFLSARLTGDPRERGKGSVIVCP